MNKIFKVIWSKSRNCYVVASELAKGHTKASSTGDKTRRLALAAITALMLLPVGGFSYAAEATTTVTDTNNTQQTVYTQDGADNTFVKKGSDNGNSLTIGASESTTYSTHQFVTGARTTYDGLNGQVVTQATGDQSSISLKVGNSGDLTYNFPNYSEVKTTRDGGTTFTYHYEDGAQTIDNNTNIKGNTVTTGSVDASNGVVDGTTQDGASVQSSNTVGQNLNALDERITNVKEYVLSETNNNYVSKTDAALQDDGAIVKKANTIGENVALLDAGLAKETADRLGADAAQDKVIKQVNDNLVASVNTINESVKTTNENMAAGFTALSQTDAAEAAVREAKDNELNERITNEANAIHETTNKLQSDLTTETTAREAADTALDTRITNVKEYLEKQTSDKYVSKDDAAVQDGAIVKAANTIGENVTNLDAALAKETAARIGADAAQDKVIKQVNDNLVSSVDAINKNMAAGFNALSQADANELAGRVAADTKLAEAVNGGLSLNDNNVLQKNTTKVNSDGTVSTSKEAATTLVMNEGKENQITLSENGVKVGLNSTVQDANGFYAGGDTADKAKAALNADGSIKGANGAFTVDTKGNVTSTGTVQGATLTDGTATISNGNIKTNGGFIQTGGGNVNTQGGEVRTNGGKVATSGGEINTGSGAIKTVGGDILTAGGKLNTSGGDIVAGTGNISGQDITASGVLSGDSLTVTKGMTGHSLTLTGGDLDAGAGTIRTTGAVETGTLKTTSNAEIGGNLDVKGNLSVEGEFNAKTLSSKLDENNYTEIHGGNVTSVNSKVDTTDGKTYTSTSTLTEKGKTETASNGINRNVNKMDATESSNVITNDANGQTSTFNQRVDEILNQINSSDTVFSKVDQKVDNITSEVTDGTSTTSSTQTTTDITNTATNGTISNNAKELTNTASDNITNKAENGNISNIASNGTISNEAKTISNKAAEAMTNDAKTITNTASESVTTQIGDGSAVQSVMNESGIANKATGKSITNDAATITNTGTTSVTNQVGNNKVLVDTTHVQSAFGDTIYTTWDENGITNNATDKTVATNAKDILNTATGNITNSAANGTITNTAKDLVNTATGNMTNTVGGELKTTVTGKVTEDYKSDLDTKVGGNETHYVAGNQTNTVSGDRTVNVKGTETENFNAQVTNVKTDQKTSVGGNQTNIVAGNQQNTVSGSKTETVKGSVTEKYGSQATTVDGDQSTHVGGNQSNVVAGDQTNTISGSKTETVKGAVSETYGSQTTKVNGDQSTTVTGKQTNSITGDQVNTIGGSQTTTVTGDVTEDYKANLSTTVGGNQTTTVIGDSSLTAENINNTAKNKITNKALDVETDASSSIVNKVSNDAGSNTSTQLSYQTTEEMSQADGKTASYLRGAAEEKSQLTDGTKKTTIDTIAGQTNTNITDGTNTSNSLQKADQVASSVTDGTNTTVVNQDAKSLASSITDGTKANNTNNTVDKSEQLIKASDTQYSATTKTATKTEDALVNGSTLIDIVKDSTTGTVSSAVTDGTNTTGITQTAKDITNTAKNGTIANDAKDIINNAAENMTNTVGKDLTTTVGGNQTTTVTGDSSLSANNISNTATTSITNKVGDNVSTTMSTDSLVNKVGKTTITTTDGKTKLTNEDGTHVTEMDYADVMKDLGVRGNATVDGDTTLGKEGADTKLTVNSKSTFKDTVKLEKTLEVDGTSTFNDKVTVTKGGLDVNGGTTTDTLHVTSTSTFDGAATFKDAVTMEKDLRVGGNATVAGSMTASSYKVGDKTYIDSNGINANNQKIVNVAAGDLSASSTDAVNGAQLYQTNERVASVENRVDTVENRVSNLDSRVDKVGANAAALANLHPLEFDADSKWNIAAAVGGYKGETATAIGAFYRPNENVMINVSSSFGTGENMYGGGISLRIGQGGNKARRNATNGLTEREKAMQQQINSLTNRLDALLSVINPNMSKEFPDVPENHWAYEAVSRLAGNGVIQGYEDGKYHGERTMTRYEMAEIIYNALSKGAKAEKKLVEEFKPELQAMAAQKKA